MPLKSFPSASSLSAWALFFLPFLLTGLHLLSSSIISQ
nr:MAG TPA: hypothetical protein [Caudoviricetes sp.]